MQLLLNVVSFVFLPGRLLSPSLLLHPFLLLFLSLSLSALSGNLQHGHQYFCCSNGQQKKNKLERSRKTSLPHPEMLLLLSCLPCFPFLTPWPPLLTPCSASAFKLQSSSVWLTFAASTLRQLLLDFCCQDKRAAA